MISLTISCVATPKVDESFTLKKNESKQVGKFTVKMLNVGHTIKQSGHSVYANLEISGNGKVEKPTLEVGEEIPLGDMFLQLNAVSETTNPKLSDPFSNTNCTLIIKDKPKTIVTPTSTPIASTTVSTNVSRITAQNKITLSKVRNAQIKLGFGKKSAVIDLDEIADVTLGGESNHRYKLFFATNKDNKIYYLFQVQSGPALSNPMGYCGGDSPLTLVWLKTDLNLKVESAISEVFASCAYNGGRYQIGKTKLTANFLKIEFEQQRIKTEISFDNAMPEKGFEIKEIKQ